MTRRLFATKSSHVPLRGRMVWLPFALAAGAWFLGYLHFIYTLPEAPEALMKADGIVALTGGAERLVAAMHLLNDGKGDRLLISGVHSDTSAADVQKLIDNPGGRFQCCVDLDRAARNTVGNAIETARWARRNGYRTLIVVTAQYHMPRSLIELRHALPDVALTPYPVFPGSARAGDWWRSPAMAKRLASEYTKCLVARLRLLLVGWLDARDP